MLVSGSGHSLADSGRRCLGKGWQAVPPCCRHATRGAPVPTVTPSLNTRLPVPNAPAAIHEIDNVLMPIDLLGSAAPAPMTPAPAPMTPAPAPAPASAASSSALASVAALAASLLAAAMLV